MAVDSIEGIEKLACIREGYSCMIYKFTIISSEHCTLRNLLLIDKVYHICPTLGAFKDLFAFITLRGEFPWLVSLDTRLDTSPVDWCAAFELLLIDHLVLSTSDYSNIIL